MWDAERRRMRLPLRRCAQLTSVNLVGCGQITDASVAALAAGCAQLTSVELYGCWQMTDASVAALAAGCPGVNVHHGGPPSW